LLLCSLKANETARSLCTPDEDSLAVLQSHLLSQQQKLQKYMDSLANNINNGIPGQVRAFEAHNQQKHIFVWPAILLCLLGRVALAFTAAMCWAC